MNGGIGYLVKTSREWRYRLLRFCQREQSLMKHYKCSFFFLRHWWIYFQNTNKVYESLDTWYFIEKNLENLVIDRCLAKSTLRASPGYRYNVRNLWHQDALVTNISILDDDVISVCFLKKFHRQFKLETKNVSYVSP